MQSSNIMNDDESKALGVATSNKSNLNVVAMNGLEPSEESVHVHQNQDWNDSSVEPSNPSAKPSALKVQNSDQIKRDILAKQQGIRGVEAAVSPGALFAKNGGNSSLKNSSADMAAKKSFAETSRQSATGGFSVLHSLESGLRAKVGINQESNTGGFSVLNGLETNVRSKVGSNLLSSSSPQTLEASDVLKNYQRLQDIESSVLFKVENNDATSLSVTNQTLDLNGALKNSQISGNVFETKHIGNGCETDKKDDFGIQSALNTVSDPNYRKATTNSLQYDEYTNYGSNESGLAVAQVIEDDDDSNIYLPDAIEYDPDAKPHVYKNRRFRLYAVLMIATAIIATIGVIVGITLTSKNEGSDPKVLLFRETIGIRETIAQFLSNEMLDDAKSPYRKALDWIMHTDPMMMTPENPRFVQRYIMAYFYFATSLRKPWKSGCEPLLSSSDVTSDTCSYTYIHALPPPTEDLPLSGMRWLSNAHECKWAGMDCDSLSQIRTIRLGGMGLEGTFPEGLVWLPYLQSVRIGFDELEGPLPDYLANMKHLNEIALPGNKFTGTIPDVWFESRQINEVNVEDNLLVGTISPAIGNRVELQDLTISDNKITGSIPNEMGEKNVNMIYFRIDGNLLNGTIPSTLGMMENLWSFDISHNQITGTIPEGIGDNWIKAVDEFLIHNNLLTGTVPASIYKAQNLIRIDMSNNQLSGSISGQITKLSSLETLSITNNLFTGSIPARIGQTAIMNIYGSGNKLNGTVAQQICELRTVEEQLVDLVLDCAVPISGGGVPEIICPTDCCSLCCEANGENCAVQ